MKKKYIKYDAEILSILYETNPQSLSKFFAGRKMRFVLCHDAKCESNKPIPHKPIPRVCIAGSLTRVIDRVDRWEDESSSDSFPLIPRKGVSVVDDTETNFYLEEIEVEE